MKLTDLITTIERRDLMKMMVDESPRVFLATVIEGLYDSKTIMLDKCWSNRKDEDYALLKVYTDTITRYEKCLAEIRSLTDA